MPVDPLDPRVVAVIRGMTHSGSSYAEIWRRARPVLERRGLACPSYGTVRRIVRAERTRRRPLLDEDGYVVFGPMRVHPWTGHVRTV